MSKKTPIINVSSTRIAIKNSFTLSLTLLMHEIIQIGVIKVVRTIKRIDIPSTPNLNLMKSSIHDFSSINWKSDEFKSKEYHRNKESIKVAELEKREI